MKSLKIFLAIYSAIWFAGLDVKAQCTSTDIMEPGFNFITSSRGCAPFIIEIQTLYLNSTPGTVYHVDWGDGSSVEDYIQVNSYPNGPIISHEFIDSPVDCGYQVTVEVENLCNPLGSVILEPINVIVWTEDLVFSDPDVYRVCHGFASSISFSDDSDWNCFPRADARENADPRWIQWIYGRNANANRLAGITIDGNIPGGFPYFDPSLGTDPKYPVADIDQVSLNVQIPITTPADIGRDFYVTLNNWNTCNQYDENLTNGALNPITPGGDNAPRVSESRIVIVDAPTPDFVARKEDSSNPIAWDYCIDDIIYFDNESTGPGGSSLSHTWEFYDGPNASDGLLDTKTNNNPVFVFSTGGQKLVRLSVGDQNAIGGCNAIVEKVVNITPTSIAQISASNTKFCKTPGSAETFDVTFSDVSIGSTINTEWRWEFYDENNILVRAEPTSGYSTNVPVPYTLTYSNPGVYKVILISRDIITHCDIRDEVNIVVYNNPEPSFVSGDVCAGLSTELIENTTLQKINNSQVIRWEWDFDYDNVTFNPDSIFDLTRPDTVLKSFDFGIRQVALRATIDQNGCNAIFSTPVEVFQKPMANFTIDSLQGCSPVTVTFDNTVAASQPVAMDEYIWCIDYGSGYIDTIHVDPNAPGFSSTLSTTFENLALSPENYYVILKAISADGCESSSSPDSVLVLPSVNSGFYFDYNPFANNCSPVEVNFQVDEPTKLLSPNSYLWTISNEDSIIRSETTVSSVTALTHTFEGNGNSISRYSVILKAEIADVCVEDSTLLLNVNPNPQSDFAIDTLEFGCDKMVLEIDAIQKGLVEYNWTINNGGIIFTSNGDEDNFTYEVARPAPNSPNLDLTFELQTVNFALCESGVSSEAIIIPSKPDLEAAFLANPLIQMYPDVRVDINNISTETNATHLWNFGDGSTSTDENPVTHEYAVPGIYNLSLSLEESQCLSIDSVPITIQPADPIIDFSFDTEKGCAPLTVNFTNLTEYGDPGTYRWQFGDGNEYSTDENPTHTFNEPGIYSVKLEASNPSGTAKTTEMNLIIEVFPNPVSEFKISPEIVKLPDSPVFTINQSIGADLYLWDFGDGTTSAEFEPNHVYADTGKYDISLISSTFNGCLDTITYDQIVEVIDRPEFTFDAEKGCAPLTVTFDNITKSNNSDTYLWRFGLGEEISTKENPVHTYNTPGIYSVTLEVTNESGMKNIVEKKMIIEVFPKPHAGFLVTPETVKLLEELIKTTNLTVGADTYFWDFGDGFTSTDFEPAHDYQNVGTYDISLIANTQKGCADTVVHEKIVEVIDAADFSYDISSGCAPLIVNFTNLTEYGGPDSYRWYFGQGEGVSSKEHPTHTYYEPGVYSVRLEVSNNSRVTNFAEKRLIIEVFANPHSNFMIRPETVKLPGDPVFTTNLAVGADSYLWDFGDGTFSTEFEPSHIYTDTGRFDISMISTTAKGCADTVAYKDMVEVIEGNEILIPNAFTPNLDGPTGGSRYSSGRNDVFYPVTEGVIAYKMQIYNRWGEILFDTDDTSQGWDGYYRGKLCAPDVYIYKIDFKFIDGREVMKFGDITLIR